MIGGLLTKLLGILIRVIMTRNFIVKQQDIKDCGICCLQSIIKYHKGYIPLEILRLDTKTNNNGTTAYNLLKTAKKYGLNGIGKKIDNIRDKEIKLPCIAHIVTSKGINHFVVIYKITDKYIYKEYRQVAVFFCTFKERSFLWTNLNWYQIFKCREISLRR